MNWLIYIGGYWLIGEILFTLMQFLNSSFMYGTLAYSLFGWSWMAVWIWICWRFKK